MDVSVGERIAAPADRRGSGRGWPGSPYAADANEPDPRAGARL